MRKRYWRRASRHLAAQGYNREPEKVIRKWSDLKQKATTEWTKRNQTGKLLEE